MYVRSKVCHKLIGPSLIFRSYQWLKKVYCGICRRKFCLTATRRAFIKTSMTLQFIDISTTGMALAVTLLLLLHYLVTWQNGSEIYEEYT